MKNLHEHVEQLNDLVDELESVHCDLNTTQKFMSIITTEFVLENPTPGEALHMYKRLEILYDIAYTKFFKESKELDKIFHELFKLRSALSEDIKQKDGE